MSNPASSLWSTPNRRVAVVACVVLGLDQFTKALVLRFLGFEQEKVVIDGFFKLVHWGNTGAAWSLFRGNNGLLAIVALVALCILFFSRRHFDSGTAMGNVAFGLIIGGIIGNLIDRIRVGHVIDFLYFYIVKQNGVTVGFPAFNVTDSAICTGVALVLLGAWRQERIARHQRAAEAAGTRPSGTGA